MASPPFNPNEALPGDTDIVSAHPSGARTFRDVMESWMLINHDTAGDHFQVNLPEQGSDPSAISNKGILYTKDVSAISELFYRDSAGSVLQITSAGSIASAIAVGTVMCFFQAAAPTGWTQVTTQNDKVLRVVSGTGGGAAGSWTISGLTVDSHTLSVTEIPAHLHTGSDVRNVTGSTNHSNLGGTHANFTNSQDGTTGSIGGGGGHVHTLTADGAWRPAYIDVIIASKD